jgi:hypothetical protein
MSIVWLGYGLLIAPAMNAERSGHALMEQLGDALGPDDSLAFVDWPEQFLLQWDKPAVHFGFRRDDEAEMQDAVSWLSGARERKLLMPEFLLDECFDSGKARFVGRAHRRNWYLADSGAMNAGCDAAGQRRIFSFDTSNSIALVGKTGTP